MSDERGKLTSVAWLEICPWLNLFTAVRLACNVRALTFAALAIVGTVAGWRICGRLCDALFQPEPASRLALVIESSQSWPWQEPQEPVVADRAMDRAELAAPAAPRWWTRSPLDRARRRMSEPFVHLFDPQATLGEFVFALLCGLWTLVVWAFCGGAITRLAAVSLARETVPSWGHLLEYARGKWTSYFVAPLAPLAGVLPAALVLAVFGLLLRFNAGLVVAGLLWFVVLLAGLYMAVLLVGLFFGWPLMWATISTEGTDAFDALSRSYAYTYQRPFHYFFYWLLAAALGSLSWFVVSIFTTAVIELGIWGTSWGSGGAVAADILAKIPWPIGSTTATGLPSSVADGGIDGLTPIRFWINVVVTLAGGFLYSYFWTATTAIYFLLRQQVDATETDEVFLPDEEETYGLTPQSHDAEGVDAGGAPTASPTDTT